MNVVPWFLTFYNRWLIQNAISLHIITQDLKVQEVVGYGHVIPEKLLCQYPGALVTT